MKKVRYETLIKLDFTPRTILFEADERTEFISVIEKDKHGEEVRSQQMFLPKPKRKRNRR